MRLKKHSVILIVLFTFTHFFLANLSVLRKELQKSLQKYLHVHGNTGNN